MTKLTPRTWYLVAAGLMVSAVTVAIVAFSQMVNTIEGMRRVVMPGKAELVIPAGSSTLYAESESLVDGKRYTQTGRFQYRCEFEEKTISLVPAAGKVSYSMSDYEGTNAFDIDAVEAGTYTLSCQSDGESQFVLALGRGIGSAVVVGAIAMIPFLLGLMTCVIVFSKRRRQQRART